MDAAAFTALALACAPMVHVDTSHALVAVESSLNQYAIGVVGGSLMRQPRSSGEAKATAAQLIADGWNFSVGLAQINVRNFKRLGLDSTAAFDPCRNLGAMQRLLSECFERSPRRDQPQRALREALSCYYSGNFVTGFKHGYVGRVTAVAAALRAAGPASP